MNKELCFAFRAALVASILIQPLLFFSPSVNAQAVAFDKMERGHIEQLIRGCPEGNALRLARLQEHFRGAGCPDSLLTNQVIKKPEDINVIAVLEGQIDSAIIVGAHFDYSKRMADSDPNNVISLSQFFKSKGIIDNWSGTVMLPVLYRTLRTRPRRHTFIFIGFAAEEKGLKGSKAYAAKMTSEEKARTKAMVNIDCLGLGTTGVYVKISDPALWDFMQRAAAVSGLPLRGVDMPRGFHFDSESFRKIKIPTITIHSTTQDTLLTPHLGDDMTAMHWTEYYDSYLLIATYLSYLDVKLD